MHGVPHVCRVGEDPRGRCTKCHTNGSYNGNTSYQQDNPHTPTSILYIQGSVHDSTTQHPALSWCYFVLIYSSINKDDCYYYQDSELRNMFI